MIVTLISPIHHFSLEKPESSFKFDLFEIRKDQHLLNTYLLNTDIIKAIGYIDNNVLMRGYNVYYYGDSQRLSQASNIVHGAQICEKLNALLDFTFNNLWFIKDNSVNANVCFINENNSKRIWRNIRTQQRSNASGTYEITSFSSLEIQNFLRINGILTQINSEIGSLVKEPEFDENNPSKIGTLNFLDYNNQMSRLNRALNFLSFARNNSFLPQKISFYIAILECLFTTDNSEVTHKIKERVSLYIGGSKEDKIRNFDLINIGYLVRSKFMHGQPFDKKIASREALIEVSVKLDQLLRILLNKIIQHDMEVFNKTNDELNNWFKDLLLG
ncbi:hypothetical protein J7E50_14160 [Pedobacter sp. ISL-68]|uniref:HEPN domain-containing protein n=1 Tax=Pedobacter sp. ISL-68 TaxID=2819165 RepID=UPI001BEA3CCF|nr:HEPN domain-containing protein [Pedobacter sp. ISL-68]MBT2591370.1 hypothetical protein [Pedobacter sp. ISL-68]